MEPTRKTAADAPGAGAPGRTAPRAETWAIGLGLVLLVVAIYGQARTFGFVNYDDQEYVYAHPLVLRGLSGESVAAALTAYRAGNWHPLTLLSHMADVTLFGLDAGWHHLVSVLLHAANALLLFSFLRRGTGATWRSAAVAALFAVHPLHVESVAWVAERKDLLSTFFFLLALIAYLRWVARPRLAGYLALAGAFVLGLLSKPMVVTLPFVLLLLDAWPLGRWARPGGPGPASGWRSAWPLVREKIPLVALSALASAIAWRAQQARQAAAALAEIPLGARAANAVVACATYLRQAVWPSGLASFYPHPAISGGPPAWQVAASALVLAAITAVAVRERRSRPWLLVGWLWYLGTLVPVLGIVQVGLQAHADRYTYVPLVGIFVAVAWLAEEGAERLRPARWAIAAASGGAIVALTVAAHAQAATWKDSESLRRRAIAVTEGNWNAWLGLGDALSEAGRVPEALGAYEEALRAWPDLPAAWAGIGAAYGRLGRHDLAVGPLERAVRLRPDYGEAWYNLGTAYGNLDRHAEAARAFREAVRANPEDARAWANLGIASVLLGDARGAAESLERLAALDRPRAASLLLRMRAAGMAP